MERLRRNCLSVSEHAASRPASLSSKALSGVNRDAVRGVGRSGGGSAQGREAYRPPCGGSVAGSVLWSGQQRTVVTGSEHTCVCFATLDARRREAVGDHTLRRRASVACQDSTQKLNGALISSPPPGAFRRACTLHVHASRRGGAFHSLEDA